MEEDIAPPPKPPSLRADLEDQNFEDRLAQFVMATVYSADHIELTHNFSAPGRENELQLVTSGPPVDKEDLARRKDEFIEKTAPPDAKANKLATIGKRFDAEETKPKF